MGGKRCIGRGVEGHEKGGGGKIRWENVRQEEGEIFFYHLSTVFPP